MRRHWLTLTLAILVLLSLPIVVVQSQQLKTYREILNDVWDRANHQLMTTSWSGGLGAQSMQTETTIFNDVYDATNHLLRTSGGGGGGGPSAFNQITSGTNTTATMVVGSGGSLDATGTGVLAATKWSTARTGCGVNNWSTGQDVNGNAQCLQPGFTNLAGTASDAQIPDLNTLSTGLTASQCVTTDGTGKLASSGAACGAGGGGGPGQDPTTLQLTDTASITINSDTCTVCYLLTLSQDTTFNAPTGIQDATHANKRALIVEITSAAVRQITWNAVFDNTGTGLPMPVATTGAGKTDVFMWRWNAATLKWALWSTSQTSEAAITTVCQLSFGSDNAGGAVLTDADLGPQLHGCMVPFPATVREITVYADAGTPSVIVHRRTGTTNTALLSSALATAGSGALACSRATAVAGYAGTVCAATLQNTTIGAGDTLGITSGTAGGTARRMSIAISYVKTTS